MRNLLSFTLIILLLSVGITANAGAQNLVARFVAGQDYQEVADSGPAMRNGRVRVTEFFLYSCPHCFHFEPALNAWRKRHPKISFDRVPVIFGNGGPAYARLYYTEAALGIVSRLHDRIFDAIQEQGRSLTNEAAIRQFMVENGVSAQQFESAYRSRAVQRKVRQARSIMRRYRIAAVPGMIVAGRYWVSGQTAGSNQRMLRVVNFLIAKARRARTASQ